MRKIIVLLMCIVMATPIFLVDAKFDKFNPLVNQAGYNLGEAKRFVCWGTPDGTPFAIINTRTAKKVYEGEIVYSQGWFSDFNPQTTDEFIVEVEGKGKSVPFAIGDHLIVRLSSKIAYDFFVDSRGSEDPINSNEANVYGGGPTRDQGAYGLESVFESILYAANPALYDNWTNEMGDGKMADLISLILWHGEFAYHHRNFNSKVANRHGTLGYEGSARMEYDFWNTLDQLAPLCAAYHSFLKPYLSEEKYRLYRQACLDKWEEYDRHKIVRYWTYSTKWVDRGFQEFNEMGNVFGQSVFSNLFMYLCEKNEKEGNPQQFLRWAQESTEDIIRNWDFNNPRHMWWIRNGEHITPQALAFFLLVAPEHAPKGTREKLAAWAEHIRQRCNNPWQYRSHSDSEMAHPKTKELGGAPALGGSLFAAAHLLADPQLRQLGWSQVDFVFGVNPAGCHISYKDSVRVARGGWWDGVETGWPDAHPNGYGKLGSVRGTLEGTPLNHHFPEMEQLAETKTYGHDAIGGYAYATEGWGVSNRGWMATIAFATLGSQTIRILDRNAHVITQEVEAGANVTVELKAALNQNRTKRDKGWMEVMVDGKATRLELIETEPDSGIFRTTYTIPQTQRVDFVYGYWGMGASRGLIVK